MLSKIKRFLDGSIFEDDAVKHRCQAEADLSRCLSGYEIEILNAGGTLGTLLLARDRNGSRQIVKTHDDLPGVREAFRTETAVFKMCAGNAFLNILEGERHTFLCMKELFPLTEASEMTDVRTCIGQISAKSRGLQDERLPTLSAYYALLPQATEALADSGELTAPAAYAYAEAFERLKTYTERLPLVLCHGDFSNKNLMQLQEGEITAIDYEDAFYGIADYDLLYWLTFLDQRRFYHRGLMKEIGLQMDADYGLLLMEMIVFLKCYLSVLNGTYKTNRISSAERLQEIAALG